MPQERGECRALLKVENFVLVNTEAGEIVEGKINPALQGILSDVSEYVCELKRVAKMDGIRLTRRITTAEDFNRNQTDRCRYPPAVLLQVGKRLKALRDDVGGTTFDNLDQKRAVNRMARDDVL